MVNGHAFEVPYKHRRKFYQTEKNLLKQEFSIFTHDFQKEHDVITLLGSNRIAGSS